MIDMYKIEHLTGCIESACQQYNDNVDAYPVEADSELTCDIESYVAEIWSTIAESKPVTTPNPVSKDEKDN